MSSQTNTLELYDEDLGGGLDPDLGPFDSTIDDLLQDVNITIAHPAGVWDGLLIPYTQIVTMTRTAGGDVQGADGSSGEGTAEIYQYMIEPGLVPNQQSNPINVP